MVWPKKKKYTHTHTHTHTYVRGKKTYVLSSTNKNWETKPSQWRSGKHISWIFKRSLCCCSSTHFWPSDCQTDSFSLSVVKQEIEENRVPNDFKVNVKVDTTPGEDLIKVLEDMRQEYEFIIKKKHQDLDTWYKEQVKERCPNFPKCLLTSGPNANTSLLGLVSQSAAMAQEAASPTGVQSSQSDLHELKRTFQALEIDLQTQCNKVSLSWKNLRSGTTSSTKPSLRGPSLQLPWGTSPSKLPLSMQIVHNEDDKSYRLLRSPCCATFIIFNVINPHINLPDRAGVSILEIRKPKPQTVKWIDQGHTVNKWPMVKPHGGLDGVAVLHSQNLYQCSPPYNNATPFQSQEREIPVPTWASGKPRLGWLQSMALLLCMCLIQWTVLYPGNSKFLCLSHSFDHHGFQ